MIAGGPPVHETRIDAAPERPSDARAVEPGQAIGDAVSRAGAPAAAGRFSLLALQRAAGNAAVSRLVEGTQAGGGGSPGGDDEIGAGRRALTGSRAGARGLVQRHTIDAEAGKDERDRIKQELIGLDGQEINGLLDAMTAADAHKRGHFRELTADPEVAGRTHEQRLRVAIDAVSSTGGTVADFALAHRDDLEAIGHIDQIDAILRRVGKFDAKPLAPGDTLDTTLGAAGAVYREEHVRVRKSQALTWMASNPGAIGEASAFKLPGAYPGKTVGPARIAIFPNDAAGDEGLLRWIGFNADRGLTVGSFFHSHAPTGEDLVRRYQKQHGGEDPPPEKQAAMMAATKGNNPERYLETVAGALGTTADALRNKALGAVDHKAVAKAIKELGEAWIVGDEMKIDAAVANASLPAPTRFKLLYTKWSRKK